MHDIMTWVGLSGFWLLALFSYITGFIKSHLRLPLCDPLRDILLLTTGVKSAVEQEERNVNRIESNFSQIIRLYI